MLLQRRRSKKQNLPPKSLIEHGQEQCNPEVWARALEAAKEIEEKYGRHNLGPYTDFEWGMLTGKMVALRWVMGCQWDDLDT